MSLLSGSSAAAALAATSSEEDTRAPAQGRPEEVVVHSSSSFSPFAALPDTLLQEILHFLSFSECRRFLGLSRNLWKLKRHIQGNMQHLTLTRQEGQRLLMMTHLVLPLAGTLYQKQVFGQMTMLQSLNMHWCCTDDFLRVAFGVPSSESSERTILFPNLQHLKMRCSKGVTDTGLGFLGGDGQHNATGDRVIASLEAIDIAFCVNTTYQGTLALRNSPRLPNLRLIRRQPESMDGHFDTPFISGHDLANEATRREVHTYYAVGSFQFSNRDVMSHGFVCQLIPHLRKQQQDGDNHDDENVVAEINDDDDSFSFLEATIQYNNLGPRRRAGLWEELAPFRPAFCLLRLPSSTSTTSLLPRQRPEEDQQHDSSRYHSESTTAAMTSTTRTVLVAQFTHTIQTPPPSRPIRLWMERIAHEEESAVRVPLGESRYFDKTTQELIPNYSAEVYGNAIMMSRIPARPFASSRQDYNDNVVGEGDDDANGPMPPQSLVDACRNAIQQE